MSCPTCGCGHHPAKRRVTEDGPERYCRKCDDWWPDDAEFWRDWGTAKQACMACHRYANRRAYERRRVAA